MLLNLHPAYTLNQVILRLQQLCHICSVNVFLVYKPSVHSLGLQPSFQALDPVKENEQRDSYLVHTVINQTLWCL